jgi:hypothetical protein
MLRIILKMSENPLKFRHPILLIFKPKRRSSPETAHILLSQLQLTKEERKMISLKNFLFLKD